MANNLNFNEWSGVTFDISKLNVNDSQRSISKNNTTKLNEGKMSLNLSINYTYTYLIQACAQPLSAETITYIVGSDTELVSGGTITYSFQSLQNPSITVCGFVIDEPFSGNTEYVMVNTYVDCDEAYTSNYKVVILENCVMPSAYTPWVVDNRFNVDDILFVNFTTDFYPSPYRLTFNAPGKIATIIPWNEFPIGNLSTTLTPVNYITYSSCDDAVEANGIYYITYGCIDPEELATLIHKVYDTPVTVLIPTATNPVKVLYDYIFTLPTEVISGGTPEIYSTIKIADGEDCPLGLSKISPEGILNENFNDGGFGSGNTFVYTTVEQPDGKLLVGGNFTQYLGDYVGNFMRLNSDGSFDETFYLGEFNGIIRAITLQSDGKILVGGEFTGYNGEYAGRLIRLNSDGSIDQGFTSGGDEFNNTVNAIAVQRDGKIVVGGNFNQYYNFNCNQIVRLNSDGTFDPTFVIGDGFDGDEVFTINIESIRNTPFYTTNGPVTYTENIIVGGRFSYYKGTNNIGGIVKLSPIGDVLPDFGNGFNQDTDSTPRVNKIVQQPDGKLIVIGGGYGHDLKDYNETWIPQNIVRLVKVNNRYVIDQTFTTQNWDGSPYYGGFNGAAFALTLLPNDKIIVGGFFSYYGDNNTGYTTSHLIRLNSDGTLDTTFTFEISAVTYTTQLLSSGALLVGGRFSSPTDRLLELFIGEEYVLRTFTTCDGLVSNIFLPTSYGTSSYTTELPYSPISNSGLDMVYQNASGDDDSNFFIELPLDFDINFLGTNYTSVYVGTNSYLTFGEGSDNYGIDPLPGDIPAETGLPGVYISTREDDGTCLDSSLVTLYTGTTDGGNTTIIRFEGNNNNSTNSPYEVTLIYNFKFYKDQSNYFDLIIEQNNVFCNDDPTGGISNGVDPTWITSFNSTGENAYRIGTQSIKANVSDRAAVCGTVGGIITTPNLNEGFSGFSGFSLFTATDSTSYNTCDDCGQIYKSIVYVRDGGVKPDSIKQFLLTPNSISNINTKGPIFTLRGTECYELLKYYY